MKWIGLLLAVSFAMGCGPAFGPDVKPNVLVIVVDDLHLADLRIYNPVSPILTPNIDAFATQAVKLTRFYVNGDTCTPTRVSLMTGDYPTRHGIRWAVGEVGEGLMPEDTTIMEVLRDAGWKTGHFGKSHLGSALYDGIAAFGMDRFVTFAAPRAGPRFTDPRQFVLVPDGDIQIADRVGHRLDLTVEATIEWISSIPQGERFYVNEWWFAVHKSAADMDLVGSYFPSPWMADRDMPEATPRHDYISLVGYMDDAFGRLMTALDDAGIAENTIVVLLSDNGGIGNSGDYGLDWQTDFMRGAKATFFAGGVNVPMLVRYPGKIRPNTVNDSPMMSMDLFDTILDLVGVDTPMETDGQSMANPLLNGTFRQQPETWFWQADNGTTHASRTAYDYAALRPDGYKLVVEGGVRYLFDTDADPHEMRNTLSDHPRIAADLQQDYEAWDAETHAVPFDAVGSFVVAQAGLEGPAGSGDPGGRASDNWRYRSGYLDFTDLIGVPDMQRHDYTVRMFVHPREPGADRGITTSRAMLLSAPSQWELWMAPDGGLTLTLFSSAGVQTYTGGKLVLDAPQELTIQFVDWAGDSNQVVVLLGQKKVISAEYDRLYPPAGPLRAAVGFEGKISGLKVSASAE